MSDHHKKHAHSELFSSAGSRKTRAHTPVDHRSGGPSVPVVAGPTQWTAVDLVHVRADRAPSAVAASETLVELLGKEVTVQAAAVFVSRHERRVATLVWLSGHGDYAKLQHAWDAHHLEREHREAVEKRDLSLCRVIATTGDATITPGSHTLLALEKLELSGAKAAEALNLIERTRPAGFVGAAVLGADDGMHSYVMHRWEHKEDLAAFRGSAAALEAIGPIGQTGDPNELYETVRTFGPVDRT
ncbi:MAG TPA: hypothetical protein VKF82_02925 [Candidatus Eremiobacteraceae bacterium]|nr:hypothetical protein [Candidatus Eremiobacteraceae bacterium]